MGTNNTTTTAPRIGEEASLALSESRRLREMFWKAVEAIDELAERVAAGDVPEGDETVRRVLGLSFEAQAFRDVLTWFDYDSGNVDRLPEGAEAVSHTLRFYAQQRSGLTLRPRT